MEPGSYRRGPRLDGDELAVGLVHRLASFVEVPQVQEHLADQLVLLNKSQLDRAQRKLLLQYPRKSLTG